MCLSVEGLMVGLPSISTKPMTKLTGPDLLAKVKELEHLSKSETAKACGYVRDNGTPQFTEFYEQVLSAKGIQPAPKADGELETYSIYIPVTTSYLAVVEAPTGSSKEQVLNALTRDDLVKAEHCDGDVWDQLKHFSSEDARVEDEECNEIQ